MLMIVCCSSKGAISEEKEIFTANYILIFFNVDFHRSHIDTKGKINGYNSLKTKFACFQSVFASVWDFVFAEFWKWDRFKLHSFCQS